MIEIDAKKFVHIQAVVGIESLIPDKTTLLESMEYEELSYVFGDLPRSISDRFFFEYKGKQLVGKPVLANFRRSHNVGVISDITVKEDCTIEVNMTLVKHKYDKLIQICSSWLVRLSWNLDVLDGEIELHHVGLVPPDDATVYCPAGSSLDDYLLS